MPLYTPVGGSWLNLAESMQHILVQRALAGQYLQTPADIIENLEQAARALRRRREARVLGVGAVLAGIALVPGLNLLVPVVGTAAMTHVLHRNGAEISSRIGA